MIPIIILKIRCTHSIESSLHKEIRLSIRFHQLRVSKGSPDAMPIAIQVVGISGFKAGYTDVFGIASTISVFSTQVLLVGHMDVQQKSVVHLATDHEILLATQISQNILGILHGVWQEIFIVLLSIGYLPFKLPIVFIATIAHQGIIE